MVAEIYNDEIVVSPADCRLHVYPSIKDSTTLWIKGKDFSINSLLQDPELAIPFRSGSIVIARLAPQVSCYSLFSIFIFYAIFYSSSLILLLFQTFFFGIIPTSRAITHFMNKIGLPQVPFTSFR